MTLPITTWQAVIGEFLAASGLRRRRASGADLPDVDHRNYLGDPDNETILAVATSAACWWRAEFLAIGASLAAAASPEIK